MNIRKKERTVATMLLAAATPALASDWIKPGPASTDWASAVNWSDGVPFYTPGSGGRVAS